MFHLSPLHRIDQGVNNWDMKIVSFLTVSHAVFDFDRIFFSVFRFWMIFSRPQCPPIEGSIKKVLFCGIDTKFTPFVCLHSFLVVRIAI